MTGCSLVFLSHPGETEAPASTQIQQSPCCAHVHYNPSLQQQSSVSSKGLNADYIIQYDVELSDLMGDVQVSTRNTHTQALHTV